VEGKGGRAAGMLTGTAYPIHDKCTHVHDMIAAGIGCRQMASSNTMKRRCICSGSLHIPTLPLHGPCAENEQKVVITRKDNPAALPRPQKQEMIGGPN
jgi:hypothetical protein